MTNRRDFLKFVTGGVTALCMPNIAFARTFNRTLVLLELKGGNDGLNTLIPYSDRQYTKLRPSIAIPRNKVITLDEKMAMHPALSPLHTLWNQRELAWIQGVGYPNPNRSHFRSIEIWESASDSHITSEQGWLSPILKELSDPNANSLILDAAPSGVFNGTDNVLVMKDVARFLKQAKHAQTYAKSTHNTALQHLLRIESNLNSATQKIASQVDINSDNLGKFPKSNLGRSLHQAARLLNSGIDIPVIKVSIGSFDTHRNQLGTHNNLLKQLAEALGAFRNSMVNMGRWDDTLIMSYSEFGRRAGENGSKGCDHGTAAPHFMLGGTVKGGLYGKQPSLDQLVNKDLISHLDFRQLYATVERDWFRQQGGELTQRGFKSLNILKT